MLREMGAVKTRIGHWFLLIVASVWTTAGTSAQPAVSGSEDANALSERAIHTGELENLDSLYAILNDSARDRDWYVAIKQIAAHGRSDKSTDVLLDFVKREVPQVNGNRVWSYCMMKVDVFMYLSLTGGEDGQKAMRDAFTGQHDYLTANWWPQFRESLGFQVENDFNEPIIRGRAAIGLLISGEKKDEKLVRRTFKKLHDQRPELSEFEDSLFWILVDSLVIADTEGRDGILTMYRSDVPPPVNPIREKYIRDGHR